MQCLRIFTKTTVADIATNAAIFWSLQNSENTLSFVTLTSKHPSCNQIPQKLVYVETETKLMRENTNFLYSFTTRLEICSDAFLICISRQLPNKPEPARL